MTLSIRMLQSMVAMQSNSIRRTEDSIKFLYYMTNLNPAQYKAGNKKAIAKRKKDIAKAVKIQKALKKELSYKIWFGKVNRDTNKFIKECLKQEENK